MSNSTPPDSNAPKSAIPWGYDQPDCRGEGALLYFTADLARIVNTHFAGRDVTPAMLEDAQRDVDTLLARYVEVQAWPSAFDGQHIKLGLEAGSNGQPACLALTTTPHLEQLILDMQRRVHSEMQASKTRH